MFPKEGKPGTQKADLKAPAEFAKALGIGSEYKRLHTLGRMDQEMRIFLEHFQKNLNLLIKKTWVEKSDENRKYTLQDEVPSFMDTLENGDFGKSIEEFSVILNELAYLLFGQQCEKEDFTEYTFRIDAQMGLFWWYGGQINWGKEASWITNVDKNILYALLLIGICYLTNF